MCFTLLPAVFSQNMSRVFFPVSHNSQIVATISAEARCDVRFGLVTYRDHPPEDTTFVCRVTPFTRDPAAMQRAVDAMVATGGGDGPEALADGLRAACEMAWRPAPATTRIAVVVTDAPPHGLEPPVHGRAADGFPAGCPCGTDPLAVAHAMAARGIAVHALGAEPALSGFVLARDLLRALARITGGQFVPLASAALLADVIVGSALEELELAALLAHVHLAAEAVPGSRADVARAVAATLQAQCVTTTRVVADDLYGSALPELDAGWAQCRSVAEARARYGATTPRVRARVPAAADACTGPAPPPVPPRVHWGSRCGTDEVCMTDDGDSDDASGGSTEPAQRAAIVRGAITVEQVTRLLDRELHAGMFDQ